MSFSISEIIEQIKNGDDLVWYLITTVVVIWLFKDLRTRYLKLVEGSISRIDKTLEIYGKLETLIIEVIDTNSDAKSFVNELRNSYPYLSRRLFLEARSLLSDYTNKSVQLKFKELLQEEISSLNYKQNNQIDLSDMDFIDSFIKILKPIVIPFIMTIAFVFLVLILIMFLISISNPELPNIFKVTMFFFFLNMLILIMLVWAIYQLIELNKFKHKIINWILVILPMLLFVGSFFYFWIGFIVFPYIIILFTLHIPKRGLKQINEDIS